MRQVRFGPYSVDLQSGELFRGEARVPIQRRPFELLTLLLERPGEVVAREELRAHLWPDGTVVDFEHGLNTAVKKLRHTLGDSVARPRYLETLPRRGYRFLAPVVTVPDEAAGVVAASPESSATLAAAVDLGTGATRASLPDRVLRAAAIHGGRVVEQADGHLLGVFERPIDALRCAFTIQRTLAALGGDFAPRMGLGLGADAPGLAQAVQLRDGAKPGQILCGRALTRRLGDVPGVGFRDIDASPAASAVPWDEADPVWLLAHAPYVGRGAELERLALRLALLRRGRGAFVLVSGEPGIGKTRVLKELSRRARRMGLRVLAGRCTQGAKTPPCEPLVGALGEWTRTEDDGLHQHLGAAGALLSRIAPGLRERLPDLASLGGAGPGEERHRILETVMGLLESIAGGEPVLLLLDDLHRADATTLALLHHQTRIATQGPILVVGAYRNVGVGREGPADGVVGLGREPGVETLELGGLAPEAVHELLETLAGHAVSGVNVEVVHRASGGNPFFAREFLLQLVRESKLERRADRRWNLNVPIEALGLPEGPRPPLDERLARVSEDARRLLAVG